MNQAQIDNMTLIGLFFGYPLCCIQFFIDRALIIYDVAKKGGNVADIGIKTLEHNQLGYEHGFIPCAECSEKVTPGTEHTLLEDRRVCSLPYPQDNYNEQEFINFLKKLANDFIQERH